MCQLLCGCASVRDSARLSYFACKRVCLSMSIHTSLINACDARDDRRAVIRIQLPVTGGGVSELNKLRICVRAQLTIAK